MNAKMAQTITFDRNGAKAFHAALDEALEGIASTFGLRIKTGTLRFDPQAKTFTVSVEANAGADTDRAIWDKLAPGFGLEASDYGRELRGNKVVGISPRGLVSVETPDGQRRHYKAKALPMVVATLHPGDERRAALARICTAQERPGDIEKVYGKREVNLIETPPPTRA